MKRILRDAVIFAICFVIIFHILDRWTFDPSSTSWTWNYIQDRNQEPIDILFMGNSHAYCNINPFMINQTMDLNTMILGGGSQPMDQTYENLKILLHYVHPKVIVLESNTLTVTTDWVYDEHKEGNIYPNFDSIRNPFYRAGAIINTVKQYNKWPEAYSQLLRPTNTWTRFSDRSSDSEDVEHNNTRLLGYHPLHYIIKYSKEEPANVERELIEARKVNTPIQYPGAFDALHKFLALTSREGIPVYIVKTPTLLFREELPEVAKTLDQMAQSDPAISGYCNFSEIMTGIGIDHDDFGDVSHLNREGSNKFTLCLIEWLGRELGIPYDLSKATGVKEESYQELPNGKYRYCVSLLDNTLIKFYTKDEKGKITFETDFSDTDSVEIPRVSHKNKLYYKICSREEIPGRSYPFEEVEYPYMHDEGILSDYTVDDLSVTQKENTFHIVNTYSNNKVQYSWYVKKDKETIVKKTYANSTDTLEYTFTDPGEYTVLSYIRLIDDPKEYKAEQALSVTIEEDGTMTYKIP